MYSGIVPIKTDIGSICDSAGLVQLKMWRVDISCGERPVQRHSHAQFEVSYVVSGSGIYTVKGTAHPMMPGDVFVYSSNEFHCITEVGSSGLSIINLQFLPQYIWGSKNDRMTPENLNFCFSHSEAFVNRISSGISGELLTILRKIESEFSEKDAEYELLIKSYLNELLIKLIREYSYSEKSVIISRKNLHSVRDAVNYIDQHLTEPLTLTEISAVSGMSSSYFSRYFKKISNITLWDYINSRRIDIAIQLLNNNKNLKIIEIATKCGFNNTANFNKAFKKYAGTTPIMYRKSAYIDIS